MADVPKMISRNYPLLLVVILSTIANSSEIDAGPPNTVVENSAPAANLPGHMKPLGSHRPSEGTIDILDSVPDPHTFFEKYLSPGKPVLFRGAAKNMKAFQNWKDSYLRDNYGDIEVEVEEGKKENRSLNLFHMKLSRFLDIYNTSDVYMVESLHDAMKDDFMLLRCLLCGGFTDVLLDAVLWFSSGGTKSVLHFDALDNINCLMDGQKDLIMVDRKEEAHIDIDNPEGSFCGVDVEKVDMVKYPGLQDVPWYSVRMEPSDCLFIPYKWFHQVSSSGRNLAVNIWFAHLWNFKEESCPDEPLPEFKPLSSFQFGNSNEQFRGEVYDHFYSLGKSEISREELTEYIISGDGDSREAVQAFEVLDENKDTIVTLDEILKYPAEQFALLFSSVAKEVFYPPRPEEEFSEHDEL